MNELRKFNRSIHNGHCGRRLAVIAAASVVAACAADWASGAEAKPSDKAMNPIAELASLSDLNTAAGAMDGVFVYLAPRAGAAKAETPAAELRAAAQSIKASGGMSIGIFTLKADAPEIAQIAEQIELPAVLALVKGRGMTPVTGKITEDALVKAIASASAAGGGCSSGCGH